MQKKTLFLYVLITAAAFTMNLVRFDFRIVLFPVLLLVLPAFAEKTYNPLKLLTPSREGLSLFLWLVLAVVVLFPPLFYIWNLGIEHRTLMMPVESDIVAALRRSLLLVGVAALPEELFFRGYLQQHGFAERFNEKLFWVVSKKNFVASFLFGLSHALAFMSIQPLATFFPSLLFGLITEKSGGRVIYSVLFHAVSNTLLFMLQTTVK